MEMETNYRLGLITTKLLGCILLKSGETVGKGNT